MMDKWYEYLLTLLIAIIGFFLKRQYSHGDCLDKRLNDVEKDYVSKETIDHFEDGIVSKLDELQKNLKHVELNYINKNDFFNEMVKIDRKIEKIIDLIIEDRGKRSE